ncbi:MAG: hypothetical protein IT279_09395 [Ignavibacteriaceae bacterium]|nr:hypothetical protein [Ignavibacteriaceae bacterium]
MKTYKAHYIAGTHWDREWYRAFQEFRWLLVEVINDLLDIMEQKPQFKHFHLDGQTCLLKDYLEIMPQNKERLRKMITEGRILIGPWFTMPDLFCVGEESLVRNLLLGTKISHEWGAEPMPVAYTCDMFGHPAQAPQIYKGFGLENCVVGRGTVESTTPAFFDWVAPDGSAIFTFKLQDNMGYGAFVTPRIILEGKDIYDPELRARAAEGFSKYIQHEIDRGSNEAICLMDALDHRPPARNADEYLALIEQTMKNVKTENSTLPLFFEHAKKGVNELHQRHGELREPTEFRNPYNWLIPNCTSSRMKIKVTNDRLENLLLRYADPLAGITALLGDLSVYPFLNLAWEQVLLNHAHDSICGSSIDQVHRDMMYRYEQAELIGQQAVSRTFGKLSENFRDLSSTDDEFTLTCYNPLPFENTRVVKLDLDFPLNYPTKTSDGFYPQEEINSFSVEDQDGRKVPYQIVGVTTRYSERTRFARTTTDFGDGEGDRYTIAIEQTMPGMGFCSLLVKPSKQPQRYMGSIRRSALGAENEHLYIQIDGDGTFSLTDKENGEIYHGLHVFEDLSETGHGWFHMGSVNEEKVLSAGSVERISVVNDGPLLVTFRVQYKLNIPARYDHKRMSRSIEEKYLSVTSDISLSKGARSVDIKTTINNPAEDHALNLLFPTGAQRAQSYFAHTPFDLTERTIHLDRKTENWNEVELTEKPFSHLFFVKDNKKGLAFISGGGLHEGGVRDDAERTMTVVMLRSYRWQPADSAVSEGLEPGSITFTYSIMPVNHKAGVAALFEKMQELQAQPIRRQTGRFMSGFPPMVGKENPGAGFMSLVHKKLVVSSFKRSEDGKGISIRLWNPMREEIHDELVFSRTVKSCHLTDMKENSIEPVLAEKNTVRLQAGGKKIITIKVEF